MQKYSEKFKSEMVRKMTGPGSISAFRLSKECGVGQPTLSGWLRQAKLEPMVKASRKGRPKRWTQAEKLRVVMAVTAAGEEGPGVLLRREGLPDADLERFVAELSEDAKPAPVKRDPADKIRIVELERELRRKDKALTEAAVLVVLSKRINDYFDPDGVGDENKESEK